MRKGLVILLAVIMTVLPAGTALAAEDTPAAGTQDAGTVLAIDNENLYPGMDQPYSSCLLYTSTTRSSAAGMKSSTTSTITQRSSRPAGITPNSRLRRKPISNG